MIELDRHIEILLLTNDCVIIPGFGGFMAHYVEARKDERDFAFLPPERTVGFNEKLVLNDSLLAQSYVEVYDISYPDAIARIEDEVRELRQHLAHDAEYEMNGIGLLRLNGDGHYEFEPCSSGILTPSLYGLSYYDMKTVAQLESSLRATSQVETENTSKQTGEEKPAATILPFDDEPSASKTAALWRGVAVACIAFIAFLLIPTPLANNDKQVMMSKVNTRLLDHVMPKQETHGAVEMREVVAKAAQRQAKETENAAENVAEKPLAKSYTIVLAARVSRKNAENYVARLHKMGLDSARVMARGNMVRVVYGSYESQNEAVDDMRKLRGNEEFGQAWIMEN